MRNYYEDEEGLYASNPYKSKCQKPSQSWFDEEADYKAPPWPGDEYSNSNFEDEADHYKGVTNHQTWNKREGETHHFLAAPIRRTPQRTEAWEQQGYEFYGRKDAKAYFKWQELMEELFVSYNYTDQRKFTTAIQ
ncbi:unnamed protein product [Arabis nemorensis]|uniref:Uncharacterized protein n=1 Tax=Arabis nemorensis TaxID=586526 RepID=A0A565BBT6_9BRAS|nr:unnamed protein product [Arabis nemorensis]